MDFSLDTIKNISDNNLNNTRLHKSSMVSSKSKKKNNYIAKKLDNNFFENLLDMEFELKENFNMTMLQNVINSYSVHIINLI